MNTAIAPDHLCHESELLIACSRVTADRPVADRIRTLSKGKLDWGYLLHIAEVHRVKPLLNRSLLAVCPNQTPSEILIRLQRDCHTIAIRNLSLAAELVQLVSLFQSRGMDVISWKGPCLASLAYRDLALRPFGDLDLLFHKRDVAEAMRLLQQRGYRLALPLTPNCADAHLAANNEIPFLREPGPIYIDVHSSLTKRHMPLAISWHDLRTRLVSVSVAGQQAPTMSVEDYLIVLSIHGAKHRWKCLSWIVDIAELIRAHPRMEWNLVEGEARRVGCRRMVHLGLTLASDVLGATLPDEVKQKLRTDPVVRKLATQVCRQLFQKKPMGFIESARFDVQTRDRLHHAARSYLSLAFTPNVSDAASVSLPSSLARLQFALRPIRLIGKYIGKVLKSAGPPLVDEATIPK